MTRTPILLCTVNTEGNPSSEQPRFRQYPLEVPGTPNGDKRNRNLLAYPDFSNLPLRRPILLSRKPLPAYYDFTPGRRCTVAYMPTTKDPFIVLFLYTYFFITVRETCISRKSILQILVSLRYV